MIRRLVQAACVAAAFVAAGAAAQMPPPAAEGRVNSLQCGTLPAKVSLDIVLLDNAEANLAIKDALAEALARRKVRIVPGAALELTLGVETVREGAIVKPPDLIEMHAGQANEDAERTGPGDTTIGNPGFASVRTNIWSNRSDSLLGGRRRVVEGEAVDQVKLSAILNRRTDGRCLWQGEVIQELDGREPAEAARALVPFLARAFGKSIGNQPLDKLR